MLQQCDACGAFAYPAREACPSCLSANLAFADAPRRGVLLAETTARVPSDVYFRERAPWRIGLVKMDCGPTIVAHLHADAAEGAPVRMSFQLDKSGQAVAFAHPEGETPNMADDKQWREMTADPKFRRVLVTNGRSVIGQEAVAALKAAGAKTVFVGVAQPWRPFAGENLLRGQDGIEIVTLDAADEKSAADLAADIGGKVDILVNTTEYVRPGGLLDRRGTSIARDEIDQAYLGFINLAQAFGPGMRMRGADGINNSAAWVNILSVYALANWPAFGAYSASQAACLSLSHCLRAELRPGGVKVMNLFTGPVDTEWFQTVPPPKVAPARHRAGDRIGAERRARGDVCRRCRRRDTATSRGQSESARARARQVTSRFQPSRRT
ncbi:SDR family NAD(P)-dependent oxidoreductase [Bradyrhizobium diazoefficiens]